MIDVLRRASKAHALLRAREAAISSVFSSLRAHSPRNVGCDGPLPELRQTGGGASLLLSFAKQWPLVVPYANPEGNLPFPKKC
jgi:hypothetical protein